MPDADVDGFHAGRPSNRKQAVGLDLSHDVRHDSATGRTLNLPGVRFGDSFQILDPALGSSTEIFKPRLRTQADDWPRHGMCVEMDPDVDDMGSKETNVLARQLQATLGKD